MHEQASSHTHTHTHSFRPTCVLLSFPDLFGESVGTSEALRECLEGKRQEVVDVVIACIINVNDGEVSFRSD